MKYILTFVIFLSVIAIFSCKKDIKETPTNSTPPPPPPPPPVDTTNTTVADSIINAAVGNITTSKAVATATFNYAGSDSISEEGFVVSLSENPTTDDKKFKADTMRVGDYTSKFKELKPNTTYYTKGYAVVGAKTFYSSQVSFTIKSVKLEDDFAGGVIIWLDSAGQHGIIAAKQGIGLSGMWGCKGKSIPGLKSGIGAGKTNTDIIVNACSTDSIAARLCSRLTHNSYSDWYLPSKDELNLLYQHRVAIGFNAAERWSSTESGADSAWAQSFDTGVAEVVDKATVLGVRPIRYF